MKIDYKYNNIFKDDVKYFEKNGFPSDVFSRLSRGVSPILSIENLKLYNALYAGHHITKLRKIIPWCEKYVNTTNKYSIVDWASGQGIASSMIIDELVRKNKLNSISRIFLIEPSEFAIKRAKEILINQIQSYGETAPEIITIQKYFNAIQASDFYNNNSNEFLHLFSNAFDTDTTSTLRIMKIIQDLSNNCFIASTSPNYQQTTMAYLKIRAFISRLNARILSNEQGFESGWIYRVKGNYWGLMNISYNQLILEVGK